MEGSPEVDLVLSEYAKMPSHLQSPRISIMLSHVLSVSFEPVKTIFPLLLLLLLL